MKREAVGHTKMKRLCRRLDIPQWQGVGLLESIWHLTAREAPAGDIGKLSDEDIALAIDYRGDEAKLIDALVGSGWLDSDPVERLVVHDWADHADDAVHMRLARARQYFVGGQTPKLARLPSKERETAHEYYSSRAPEPASKNTIWASGVSESGAQNGNSCVPPEPVPGPEPLPDPVREPVAVRALRGPAVALSPIRFPERKCTPGGIPTATWDDFRNRYATSGKGLNEIDWAKAAQEAVTLGLSESDLTERVIPCLAAELPEWADRDIGMIPLPGNWLKATPWTRIAKPREPPLSKEAKKQREIDRGWEELAHGTR